MGTAGPLLSMASFLHSYSCFLSLSGLYLDSTSLELNAKQRLCPITPPFCPASLRPSLCFMRYYAIHLRPTSLFRLSAPRVLGILKTEGK